MSAPGTWDFAVVPFPALQQELISCGLGVRSRRRVHSWPRLMPPLLEVAWTLSGCRYGKARPPTKRLCWVMFTGPTMSASSVRCG